MKSFLKICLLGTVLVSSSSYGDNPFLLGNGGGIVDKSAPTVTEGQSVNEMMQTVNKMDVTVGAGAGGSGVGNIAQNVNGANIVGGTQYDQLNPGWFDPNLSSQLDAIYQRDGGFTLLADPARSTSFDLGKELDIVADNVDVTGAGVGTRELETLSENLNSTSFYKIPENPVEIPKTTSDIAPGALKKGAEAGASGEGASGASSGAGEAAGGSGATTGEKAAEAAGEKTAETAGGKAAGTAVVPENVYSHNPVQYIIVILEGMEGRKTKEVSKEVSIKAQELQDSQGAQTASASMASEMSTRLSQERNPISATTIADASNAMIELLNMTKIDLNLLSTVVERQDEPAQVTPRGPAQIEAIGAAQEGAASSLSSSAASGTSSASGGSQRQTVLEGETTVVEQHETTPSGESPASDDDDTTYKKEQIRKRRAMMLAEWAIAATQIGEGSNAISNQFYERAEAFVEAANEAAGSLGGMSAINDTDRFVLFELTRGGALSAVQLGLQGATNLNELEDES